MVTGGHAGERGYLDSVELLNLDGTRNCTMSPMLGARTSHSQSGPVSCGGWKNEKKSCVTFSLSSGEWEQTHTLAGEGRVGHSAWSSPQGIVLIGSYYDKGKTTTEILRESGDTTPGFTLDYRTE